MNDRRWSCPLAVQQLWDTVTVIRFQRQTPDINRISNYMMKVYNMSSEEVGKQLDYCVRDGFLKLIKGVRNRPDIAIGETEEYKVLTEKVDKGSNDYYCFQCHKPGYVIKCTSCFRVYHYLCINKNDFPFDKIRLNFICNICKICKITKDVNKDIKNYFNSLLCLLTDKLKEKMPLQWTERKIVSTTLLTYSSDRLQLQTQLKGSDFHYNRNSLLKDNVEWRVHHLIFNVINLQKIKDKTKNDEYNNIEEFRADILCFMHNIIIFHGVDSSMADCGRIILKQCDQDLEEIMKCHDCYKYSVHKTKFWFCKPCEPDHEVVCVKKKLIYWPAKVIKIEGDNYEVRFFGDEHKFEIIKKSNIFPITSTLRTRKPIPQWTKACLELSRYQLQLNKFNNRSAEQCATTEEENEQSEIGNLSVQNENLENTDNEITLPLQNETDSIDQGKERNEQSEIGNLSVQNENLENTDNEITVPLQNETDSIDQGKESSIKNDKKENNKVEYMENIKTKSLHNSLPFVTTSPEVVVKKRQREVDESTKSTDNCSIKIRKMHHKSLNGNNDTYEENQSTESVSPLKTTEVNKFEPKKIQLELDDEYEDEGEINNISNSLEVQSCDINSENSSQILLMDKDKNNTIKHLFDQYSEKVTLLQQDYKKKLSKIKKKRWCMACEKEAAFHCCWNTAYCDERCQLFHWVTEHKFCCTRNNRVS